MMLDFEGCDPTAWAALFFCVRPVSQRCEWIKHCIDGGAGSCSQHWGIQAVGEVQPDPFRKIILFLLLGLAAAAWVGAVRHELGPRQRFLAKYDESDSGHRFNSHAERKESDEEKPAAAQTIDPVA